MAAVAFAGGASSILAYIDTAVAVATFLVSERLPATIENIQSFFSRSRRERPASFRPEEAQGLVTLLVIDPDLLDDLATRVGDAITSYRACLRNAPPFRPQESAACDRRAEIAVCDAINRVQDRNNDVLPTDYLRDQWQSFRCVRV